MIGYAFCGSFCTLTQSLSALKILLAQGYEVQPIMSEMVHATDTRFWQAKDFLAQVKHLCQRDVICSIVDAEPLGPKTKLDALVIAPCTGNTLAKMAHGITDTTVTMAAKAHSRCNRPLLIALASNDAMSANLANIATLLARKSVYFVPMKQDDPVGKPHSLVADFGLLPECLSSCVAGRLQKRPLFV